METQTKQTSDRWIMESLTITSISTCNSMFLSYLYSHSFSLWPSTSCWLKAKFLVSDAKPQTPSVHFKKMHAATSMSAVFFFYHHFGFFCDLCMKSWFLELFFCCNIVASVGAFPGLLLVSFFFWMDMALFRKFFYRKAPDGLLEISDRVYGTIL